jgi:hypothetical protein
MTKKQDMGTRHPDVWKPVLASKDLDRLRQPGTGADLVRAMADPRVRDLDFEPPRLRPPVREVKL